MEKEIKIPYERLLKIAKEMHLWIFHHTFDEQKAYDECGLTANENAILGYGGQVIIQAPRAAEDTPEEIELKPCPFCGCEAEVEPPRPEDPWFYAHCTNCFAQSDGCESEVHAREFWNMRRGDDV